MRIDWHAPVIVLKTLEVPSAEAVTNFVPVLLNATSRISSLWPRKVWTHWPDATSQILHVLSMEPEMQRSDWGKVCCENCKFYTNCEEKITNITYRVIKLSRTNLPMMPTERVSNPSIPSIPDLDGMIETTSNYPGPVSVEVETYNLRSVAQQSVNALPRLNVPQSRRIVHATSSNASTHRVEAQADDLGSVPPVSVVEVAIVTIP